EGRVAALQVRRRGDAKPKYLFLSGGGGRSCGNPVHFPLGFPPVGPDSPKGGVVRITEGFIKADVAQALSSVWTVCIPGVASWARVLEDLPWYELRPQTI